MRTALGVFTAGCFAWVAVLLVQDKHIRARKRCAGQLQGIDWDWENPLESGRSMLFSVPWTKNLRTGETERWNLKGEPL